MFGYCTGLTEVIIPDSVTRINGGAFIGCTSLKTVRVPDTVTQIGEDAFLDVPHLIYHGPAQSDNNWGAKRLN